MMIRKILKSIVYIVIDAFLLTMIIVIAFNYYNSTETLIDDVNTISFSDDVSTFLATMYGSNENEIVYCLYGYTLNNNTYIDKVIFPEVLESSPKHIVYRACQQSIDYVGILHTHSLGNCDHSDTDLFSFGRENMRHYKYSKISGVQCGEYDFKFIAAKDVELVVPVV